MYSYYTNFDIEECKQRINIVVKDNRFLIGEIKGRVNFKTNKFHLLKTSVFSVRNSYSRIFYGKMFIKGNGTTIQGNFFIPIFEKMIEIFLLGSLIYLGRSIYLSWFSYFFLEIGLRLSDSIIVLITECIFLMFEMLWMKFGWLARNEEKYILEFIKTKLWAVEVDQIK